jgi:hypothetical protein
MTKNDIAILAAAEHLENTVGALLNQMLSSPSRTTPAKKEAARRTLFKLIQATTKILTEMGRKEAGI